MNEEPTGSVEPKDESDDALLFREFEFNARRPLRQRWQLSFIRTYRPVYDDDGYRSFESMQEYREWCASNVPEWLGYA